MISKFFPKLRKTLKEDLFNHSKHLEQSEIYSAAEFIGLQNDDIADDDEGGTVFSNICNFDYQDLNFDPSNIW
jgi:hypothetical protein